MEQRLNKLGWFDRWKLPAPQPSKKEDEVIYTEADAMQSLRDCDKTVMSNPISQCYRYKEPNRFSMDKFDSGNVLASDEDVANLEEGAQSVLNVTDAIASESDQQPQPSGSRDTVPSPVGVSADSNKSIRSTSENETDTDSPQVPSKRTSTPKKKIPERRARAPRVKRRRARVPQKQTKQMAKVVLEEARQVALEPDSSFDGLEKQSDGSRSSNQGLEQLPEFDSTSSSVLNELRVILEDLDQGRDDPTWDSTDPDVTNFLVGLVNDPDEKFSNPFQLTESVRRELIQRAEASGARALSWDLPDFDRIGGNGMIRRVWSNLKADGKVTGMKRSISDDSVGDDTTKKLRLSLNLSGTCDRIENIELAARGENSMVDSFVHADYEREFDEDAALFEQVPEPEVAVADHEENQIRVHYLDDVLFGIHSDDEIGVYSDDEIDLNELMTSGSEVGSLNGELNNSSGSIPVLESSSDESNEAASSADSGVINEIRGNVTNLCRRRCQQVVRTGMITETGPFLPISLGFS